MAQKSSRLRAAAIAIGAIGLSYDVADDLRLKYCKRESPDPCLLELDHDGVDDVVLPGGFVVPDVPKSIKCDKGERMRFRSDVLSFQQGLANTTCPSDSPDGPGYVNAQRGAYALEKSGNFCEGTESRIVSSLPDTSRPGSGLSQADPSSMFQFLLSDLKPAGLEQKFPRAGEIKRSLNNILGVSSDDSIPATVGMTLTMSAREEIRRMKSNLSECSIKARNQLKAFGEVVSKIDKYTHGLSKNRSRADILSGERPNMLLPRGVIPRTGAQSHLAASGLDNGAQKSEERSKSVVPSRRARTAAREAGRIDVRANGTSRPSVAIDRDTDVFKHVNGATTPHEEKGRAISTGVDGWKKSKTKKKRSVIKLDASTTAGLDRPVEGDRELRQAMQQKLTSHARPRLNNTHGLSVNLS